MTIDRWIVGAAARDPDKTALIFGDQRLTYSDMAARIDLRAAELQAAGLCHGDRVAWYGLNHSEMFVLLFACARLGAMFVPLNWRLARAEIAAIVANATPFVVIHDDHFANDARMLEGVVTVHHEGRIQGSADVESDQHACVDDPILLVYTSGSTGKPKGVVLTQKALIANARMSVEAHELTPDDIVLNVLPMFHVGGLNILPTPAFSIGATVEIHEKFDPVACCAAMQRVTAAILVPTVLQALMAAPGWDDADFGRLRIASIGSTDVPVAMIEAMHARGVPIIQVYGATETAPFAIYQTLATVLTTVGSIGRVGPLCQVRLMQDGAEVAPGEPGEIWVKGDNVLREYWRDPAQSAELITDGWFHTGDVARCDEDGLYWFTDRIKHVIISGGENIYPAEVERILRGHPDVSEVSVVGRADAKWGEVPVAVVVARSEIPKASVLEHLKDRIARYKQPKDVVFVGQLPRNAMGKIVASEVRKLV